MEFPEDFNQLELLDTHGHLIPRGGSSLWTASRDEDTETDEGERSEEWYLEKEDALKDEPKELLLWAAENNRVSSLERGLQIIAKRSTTASHCFKTIIYKSRYSHCCYLSCVVCVSHVGSLLVHIIYKREPKRNIQHVLI